MSVTLDLERAALSRPLLHRAACLLTGNADDADDLVQDTFEALIRRPRVLRESANVPAYLRAALERRHVDLCRRSARGDARVELDEVLSRPAVCGERPEARAEQSEVLALVRELPSPLRAVMLAVVFAGLSYEEAATALGIPKRTVTSRLHRARGAIMSAARRQAAAAAC